jgi:hypothetical protein
MSVGPLGGIATSAAGSPLAQTRGSDVERAQQDTADQHRRIDSDQKAENAAGIGEADGEDHETAERDADGRRIWEEPAEGRQEQAEEDDSQTPPARQSRDATGEKGTQLDLTG